MANRLNAATAAFTGVVLMAQIGSVSACVRPGDDLPKGQVVAEYTTDITAEDLTNSRGVRLTDYRQILQQDRYNAHEQGLVDGFYLDNGVFDPFDLDTYFTSLQQRSQIPQADYSLVCADDLARLRPQIEAGRLQGFLYVRAYQAPSGGLRLYLALVG